ncbi:hypothetical protein ACWKWC_23700, partial [Geodermatophilus nigrescens]
MSGDHRGRPAGRRPGALDRARHAVQHQVVAGERHGQPGHRGGHLRAGRAALQQHPADAEAGQLRRRAGRPRPRPGAGP